MKQLRTIARSMRAAVFRPTTFFAGMIMLIGTSAAAQPVRRVDHSISHVVVVKLYQKNCAACHSTSAQPADPPAPRLAGQKADYLLQELIRVRDNDRNAPVMHRVLSSDPNLGKLDALKDLASYIAAQPHIATLDYGGGLQLNRGRQLFESNCAQCHGDRAEGSDVEPIPSLAGQDYKYLLYQLRLYAAGHRNYVERPFIDFTAGLTEGDRDAIADYLSRQPGDAGSSPSRKIGR